MTYRRDAFATLRIDLGGGRPTDAVLQIRIRCWLARVACAIERRDTPQASVERPAEPGRG